MGDEILDAFTHEHVKKQLQSALDYGVCVCVVIWLLLCKCSCVRCIHLLLLLKTVQRKASSR